MRPEILAPAGDEQTAYAALNAGADAIYLGLSRFSAREGAANFDGDALLRVTRFAHLLHAKVYVALNTLVKDGETADFFASVREAWERGADAILMQDLFLGKLVKEKWPEIVLHLSTQGGCCNRYGAEAAKEYGFSRVVLARETPLADIAEISAVIETEAFVQGALCTCFSGQCYFSSFAGNNSGNRGRCKQPCRKLYSIDRAGYETPAYALSLSDLSVGEEVKKFLDAGVCSLKIEGRMRRPAYCAAAVRYVRECVASVLGGKDAGREAALSDLKRAYNRGNYTRGLAFGQDETLLSRDVQGHIGEEVGQVAFIGGRPFCASGFRPRKGDAFKILRGGKEVAGAVFARGGEGGFFLSSNARLLANDAVCVTTDAASSERVLSGERKREIALHVRICAGEEPRIRCGDFVYTGGEIPQAAKNAPLDGAQIAECFSKTDGLPLLPTVTAETEGAFLPKSALNALRRDFYAALCEHLDPRRTLAAAEFAAPALPPATQKLTAHIAGERGDGDIAILKPDDYSRLPAGGPRTYLYLPPLFTGADEALVGPFLKNYEGIYCEGYYGIALARKYGVSLFAGTGFNLTNRFAVAGVMEAGAKYFALSKEISAAEQRELNAEGAFALSQGAVKVMDLCYCPFEKTCASCDRRKRYTLTDGEGRKFPLRRYVMGSCRFEVYNCAPLSCEVGADPLIDSSVSVGGPSTRGHAQRSML